MREPILAITGDTHGEDGRLLSFKELSNKYLKEGDYLFICGDFGYLFDNSYNENQKLKKMAKLPYTICFCDGNHENFDLLDKYSITTWNGGKAHVIEYDKNGTPKIVHLMRGQVFLVEGCRIFVFGGAYSIDKAMREEGRSWWAREMPNDDEMKEAISNLEAVDWKVDYIITHAAPEETMSIFHPDHIHEMPLNGFLEYIRENTMYTHWYMGHLHRDEDIWRHQTILWFSVKNMKDNTEIILDA